MTVFSRIHKSLDIPVDYYIAEVQRPRLDRDLRNEAVRKLISAGEIKEDSKDALLDAMCRKFGKYVGARDKRKIPTAHDPWRSSSAKKFAKSDQIMAALIEDPKSTNIAIANRLEVGETTVRRYRDKLRKEGQIP